MSDIVEKLRDTVQILATTQMNLSMEAWDRVSNAVLEAAETITALRAENEKLRTAAQALIDFYNGPLEAKRPDVFHRLMVRLNDALQ